MSAGYYLKILGVELIIELETSIDEDFTQLSKENFESYNKIVIDFDKVKNINSCGIREWIIFLNQVKGKKLVYKNCRKIIVDQINIVHGFINPDITIESIYLPFFCEQCDKDESRLFKLSDIVNGNRVTIVETLCSQCNKPMDFDEVVKQYFQFVSKV